VSRCCSGASTGRSHGSEELGEQRADLRGGGREEGKRQTKGSPVRVSIGGGGVRIFINNGIHLNRSV
jgi:hypothetical protein